MLIAIDGPAGSGKSTVARRVARELGFTYLDSGAMYRSVALLWLACPAREPAELAREARIELGERVLLDGRDVSAEIRSPEVTEAASVLAAGIGIVAERERSQHGPVDRPRPRLRPRGEQRCHQHGERDRPSHTLPPRCLF